MFGLSAATLILFWAVKDTKPSGSAVLPILYGALGASALIWLIAEVWKRRAEAERRRRRGSSEAENPFRRRAIEQLHRGELELEHQVRGPGSDPKEPQA